MKLLFRFEIVCIGYGFVLNQYIVQSLESPFQRREICLLLKNSLDLLYQNMEDILFILMVIHGILKPVYFCIRNIDLHSSLENNLTERVIQYFKERVESFNDYYPCNSKRRDCDNSHVYNWVELFVSMYNNTIVAKNNPIQIINEMVVFS